MRRLDPKEVIDIASTLCDTIEAELHAGKFDHYRPATMDDGIEFRDALDAIGHCSSHEAYHLGIITSMVKCITVRNH